MPPFFIRGTMSKKPWSIWLGFDPRPEEMSGYAVARGSIRKFHRHAPIRGLVLSDLTARGV